MSRVTPINTGVIMDAVLTQLRNDPGVQAIDGLALTRGEWINNDPGRCPWAGLYCIGEDYAPRALGFASGYREQHITLALVLQESSRSSGQDCQDKLEALKQAAMGAILTDPTLSGSVAMLMPKLAAVYMNAKAQGNTDPYFQTVVVQFAGIAQTAVSP